jgi:ketosteroid isomerase-like protein
LSNAEIEVSVAAAIARLHAAMAKVADGVTGWSNRVTHIFRREPGEWRLLHRHGNRLEAQHEPAAKLAK